MHMNSPLTGEADPREQGDIMDYLVTIGLEVHVQLSTRSKMFCACPTEYGAPPNTQVCPVCLGYPGAMPTMNEEAVRLTVMAGLMLGCEINLHSKFDRKSYFYPDMPKNYQISQYDEPLCLGGAVAIDVDGRDTPVQLKRIHLEEDVGKSMHFTGSSGVDFNRAGTPLMEIVSEADLHSPEEAFAYLQALKELMVYAGVSACNLEEGNMRCDVNTSLRPPSQQELGTKTEIKNLNTFKGVLNALRYETRRQAGVLDSGGTVVQETRRWDAEREQTFSMRTKEDAHDYRYFPEPDLMPVVLDPAEIESMRDALPEAPRARRARFMDAFGLPEYDAGVLVADRSIADYFEAVTACGASPKAASNWVMTEMQRLLTESGKTVDAALITPDALAKLIGLVEKKTLNSNQAKELFAELFARGGDPEEIAKARGMAQVSDSGLIEEFVDRVLEEHAGPAQDYRNGKEAALQFLVGQVMRLSRGKANPQMVGDLLREKLS